MDCEVSYFGNWSECSVTCGGGTRTKERTATAPVEHGGELCPDLTESESCNLDPCPVDCVVSDWSTYGECSHSCGGGTKMRTRTESVAAAHGGATCGSLSQGTDCNGHECPIDCELYDWVSTSSCSLTCGGGEETQRRDIKVHPEHGCEPCDDQDHTVRCNEQDCPVDCVLSNWTERS